MRASTHVLEFKTGFLSRVNPSFPTPLLEFKTGSELERRGLASSGGFPVRTRNPSLEASRGPFEFKTGSELEWPLVCQGGVTQTKKRISTSAFGLLSSATLIQHLLV